MQANALTTSLRTKGLNANMYMGTRYWHQYTEEAKNVRFNTRAVQANALTTSLRSKGLNANVYVGMRYWHPYTEEALEQIKRDTVGRLVILPLYPQFSISTSGSSLRLLVSTQSYGIFNCRAASYVVSPNVNVT